MKLYRVHFAFACLICVCTAAAMEEKTDVLRAAWDGKTKQVSTLLTNNPDLVNVQDVDGWTPLYVASWHRKTETAAVLLKHKADVNAQNKYKQTSLHRASFWGRTEIAELLLQHKADVNAQDVDGWTPLYGASRWDHPKTAELLLSYGAIPYRPINLFENFSRFSKLYAQGHQAFINKARKEREKVFLILYSIERKEGNKGVWLPRELCYKIVALAFSGIQEWHQFKKAHPEIAALSNTQEGKLS